jgi:hypothetical protein
MFIFIVLILINLLNKSFMKKRYPFFFFLSMLISFSFIHQHSLCQWTYSKQWDAGFGGFRPDLLTSFLQARDGGYMLAGYSQSLFGGDKTQTLWGGIGDEDYWIVKIDSAGKKEWDKDFGGLFADKLYAVKQTADGGYLLAGESASGINGDKTQPLKGNTDYWIIKTDSAGTKLWDKDFGGTDYNYLNCMIATNDGGFMLGGISSSPAGGDKSQPTWGGWDFWIIKIDAQGNKIWDKDFGGSDHDYLNAIEQTADGGYLLGGHSLSDAGGDKSQANKGLYDYWIVKIDSLGTKQWDKDFGGILNEYINSVHQTNDNGYILAGISENGINGDKTQPTWGGLDFWIIKTDSSGNFLWDRDYGGNDDEDFFGNITAYANCDLLLAGISYSNTSGTKTEDNLGVEQSWLVKIDSAGNVKWDKTIFTEGHDEEGYAIQTSDGCIAIANYTTGGIAGYKSMDNRDSSLLANRTADYWIVKFCDSTLTSSVNETVQNAGVILYPNPASEHLNIKTGIEGQSEVNIYDITHRKILYRTFINSIVFNIKEFETGIYFVEVKNNQSIIFKGKLIKE